MPQPQRNAFSQFRDVTFAAGATTVIILFAAVISVGSFMLGAMTAPPVVGPDKPWLDEYQTLVIGMFGTLVAAGSAWIAWNGIQKQIKAQSEMLTAPQERALKAFIAELDSVISLLETIKTEVTTRYKPNDPLAWIEISSAEILAADCRKYLVGAEQIFPEIPAHCRPSARRFLDSMNNLAKPQTTGIRFEGHKVTYESHTALCLVIEAINSLEVLAPDRHAKLFGLA